MILFLQANDTFFFRDGRPFTKGDQSEGYSIFPPLPATILGALRTAYIAEYGNLSAFYAGKMANTIGTPDSLGSIKLKGVFLADRDSRIYFPIPLDLVVKKNDNENRLYAFEVQPKNLNLKSNTSLNYLLRWTGSEDEDVEPETSGKFEDIDMTEYLLASQTEFLFRPHRDFVCDEPKTGIQRNRETLTSEDSMLYRINMSRFQTRFLNPNKRNALSELGFVVDYDCKEKLPSKGLLKLGGEGKSFFYEQCCCIPDPLSTEDNLSSLKAAIRDSGSFKLYFATPSIFEQGWLPEWISKETQRGEYPTTGTSSISVELVTAAVGKPIPVGGWDMKKGRAKPTCRAVPAGSVYYFKVHDEDCVDLLVKTFHYQNISDYRSEEGFGLCFVGVAKGV